VKNDTMSTCRRLLGKKVVLALASGREMTGLLTEVTAGSDAVVETRSAVVCIPMHSIAAVHEVAS